MSNNTNNSCYISQDQVDLLKFVVYRVIASTYFISGLSTNFILLLAFYKQSKTEAAYGYQVAFTASKFIETFFFGTFQMMGKWFGPAHVKWFVTSYGLVSFYTYTMPLHITFIISSLLLSLAMACDRVFALLNPLVYRNINHIRHQIVACATCFLLGFLGAGAYFFESVVDYSGGEYTGTFSKVVEYSIGGQISFYAQLTIRVSGICLLLVFNLVMIYAFRKRMRKVDQKEQERKANERTLFLINIYQCCMMLLNQLPQLSWGVIMFAFPVLSNCEGKFVGPIGDAILMITDALDFPIIITINRRMRRVVLNLADCAAGHSNGKAQGAGAGNTARSRLHARAARRVNTIQMTQTIDTSTV